MERNINFAPTVPTISGTVNVQPGPDPRHLVGDCPVCGNRLRVDAGGEDSVRGMVACLRCRTMLQIEPGSPSVSVAEEVPGFGISYAVEGPWDPAAILEHLFDTVGPVEYIPDGFVCYPDDHAAHIPTIMVDERSRIVRLGLFGQDTEGEAAAIIHQAVSELASRFQLVLAPMGLDRWVYRRGVAGLALIDHRPLGTLMKEPFRRTATA